MKTSFLRRWPAVLCCGAVLLSPLTSCTWRQVGCTAGATLTVVGVKALLNAEKSRRAKSGKKFLSNAEEAAILAAAGAIGCLVGSEIAGGLEKYVEKKREEYRTEAEYLQAHIDDLNKKSEDIDAEIAWLESESEKLQKEKKNLKNLPALQAPLNSKLQEAAVKRETAAKDVEQYLLAARSDAQRAYDSSSDAETKAEFAKVVNAYDTRLDRARKVRSSITRIAY